MQFVWFYQIKGILAAYETHPCALRSTSSTHSSNTIYDIFSFKLSIRFCCICFFLSFERVEMILKRIPSTSSTKHFMFHSLYCPCPMSLKSFLAKKKMIFWNVRCCYHKMKLTSTLWIRSRSRTDLKPFPSAHLSRGPLLLLHLLLSHQRVQYSNFDDQ